MIYLWTVPRAIVGPWLMAIHLLACCAWFIVVSIFTGRRDLETKVIRDWAKGALWISGTKVRIKGVEKIPDGGVIYIFNHQSNVDIPIIHASVPRDFRFGAKAELFRIPIFNWAMRRSGALEIPRAQRNKAFNVLERAEARIRKGESFVLAPEGTRQDRDEIGQFRSGPFVVALKAQAPIVPILIRGAGRIMPKNSPLLNWKDLWNYVDAEVLDPIVTAGMTYEDREKLKNTVRERMVRAHQNSAKTAGLSIDAALTQP
ncbi:MAG: lysophospholipid acyltransferase family protein [Bdellovibrionia bacterium]